ncbi:endonuclease domain-containing protein [uncultured Prevotella sp.]|uniref:endonuclease domain-containing protein n=1 Tax=uncultured Prevotella sp. TaxID=159272 RepID=UPI00258AC684|nr:endonuclease domain-containing protein [uncultured Prevotella sp.]
MDVRQINNNSNTNSNSSLSREDIGGSHLSRDEQKSSLSREDLGGSRSKWMTADPTEYELLKENAKSNRKNMTEAESVFWSMVKGSALGQRCLRQHIIGDYIVDFLFRKSKLVVEIDGGYHFTDEQQEDDALRTDWLEHQGYKIIRFKNEQVLFDTNKVIEILKVSLSREI